MSSFELGQKGMTERAISNVQHRALLLLTKLDRLTDVQRLVFLWAMGSFALALVTFVCFQLGLNFAAVALAFLIVIVLLCLLDSFISSAIFSAVAVGILSFFFTEPLYSFAVDGAQDLIALVAFLITSLVVTSLVRRVRDLGAARNVQARLLDLTIDAVFVRDRNDVITYWNRGAEEIYGWKRGEALGKVTHELLQTVFSVPLAEINKTLARTGRWEGELLHTTRTGTKVSVASRWSQQEDERGLLAGTLESNSDVTQRKRAEDVLRRSQAAYLSEAQRLSQTGSFGWNVTDGQLFWSDETYRIFGYEPETSPSIDLVLQRVHSDDVALVRQMHDRAAVDKVALDFEHRLLMPDGLVKHVHVVAHVAPNGPGHLQFIGAVSDITTRKEAQERIRLAESRLLAVINTISVVVWSTEPNGDNDFHNERLLAYTGFSAEKPLGGGWKDMIHPDDLSRHVQAWVTATEAGTSFECESRLRRYDGQYRWFLARAEPLRDDNGNIIKWYGTNVDIDDRERAEDSLRRMQADFAHAARASMLGELTASIAHEVNQPLAAIAANGDVGLRWLSQPEPDLHELREVMESVVSDARRAADIISRIRAMAARRAPEQTLLSLDDVIGEALEFLRHEVQSRGVTVLRRPAPIGASQVRGDRTQLQQVFVNLVINAMQAMAQANSAARRITIETVVDGSATVRCSVEDSGPGIKPEHLNRLFESFFTTKVGGMGMGLVICRSIIAAHSGRIAADNDGVLGGGRFSFSLPAAS